MPIAIGVAVLWFGAIAGMAAWLQQRGMLRNEDILRSRPSARAPASDTGTVNRAYLEAARWAQTCTGSEGASIRLEMDGSFTSNVGSGRWDLAGSQLSLSYSDGQRERLNVQRISWTQWSFNAGTRTAVMNRC